MTVAATEGKMSTANFVRYFSMPATPRTGFDAGTSGHIEGSTATDRWQLPPLEQDWNPDLIRHPTVWGPEKPHGFSSTSRNTISLVVSLSTSCWTPALRKYDLP